MKGKTVEGVREAAAARAAGEKYYFTGLPCKSGHVAKRLTLNTNCVECVRGYKAAVQAHETAVRRLKMQTDPAYAARRRASKAAAERNRRAKADPAIRAAERRQRQAAVLLRLPKWADMQRIRAIYKEAARLKRETGEPWHVDHYYPLNGEAVSGLHVPENLRPMRAVSNLLKGSKHPDDL